MSWLLILLLAFLATYCVVEALINADEDLESWSELQRPVESEVGHDA